MNKILNCFLKKFIEKNYKLWGTIIQPDLPPEFIITEHAYEKINERFHCNEDKIHKIVLKAWKSQEILDPNFINRIKQRHSYALYKYFNGYIFVFRLKKVKGFDYN